MSLSRHTNLAEVAGTGQPRMSRCVRFRSFHARGQIATQEEKTSAMDLIYELEASNPTIDTTSIDAVGRHPSPGCSLREFLLPSTLALTLVVSFVFFPGACGCGTVEV